MNDDFPGLSADTTDGAPVGAAEAAEGVLPGAPNRTRPPGSGRAPGTQNRVNRDTRELILRKGQPVEFLCRVLRGKRIRLDNNSWWTPTPDQRMQAGKWLLDRVSPVLAAAELTGKDGEALVPPAQPLSREELVAIWAPVAMAALEGMEQRQRPFVPAVITDNTSKDGPPTAGVEAV